MYKSNNYIIIKKLSALIFGFNRERDKCMNSDFKRTLVTAALPYANGPVHIGHLAGCYLPSDIYVRYLRSVGHDVKFICGSDEHGAAITIKAKKENTTPQAIVDQYHSVIRDSFETNMQL